MTTSQKKSAAAMGLPKVDTKIMERSYQRSGEVGAGTLLSSGTRQVTCTFMPKDARKLQLAANHAGVSTSEMIRQCVRGYLPG